MVKKIDKINDPGDLFAKSSEELKKDSPLSARMRPQTLEEYVGQTHILGKGKLLTRAIEADRITSLILYGPPGVGKTTLAYCIGQRTKSVFEKVNAVASNVEQLKKILVASQHRRAMTGERTILFIDEIHRFNKAQQDVLMPDVEEGNIILIGATVFNPFFSLISPLLSRSLVFELNPLTPDDIKELLERALVDPARGFGKKKIEVKEESLDFLSEISDGDARKALNALELAVLTTPPDSDGKIVLTLEAAQESVQKKQVKYDRQGDEHYDTASAFIKSMRGSDPHATLYWLAKMIYAGEDPRFISRRICICAAEDVGNADPQALVVANAAAQITEFIGMPEARIPLAQAAVYIACAPKSNAVYLGIDKAIDDVKNKKTHVVPNHLRDASYPGAKKLKHGEGYRYAHSYEEHYVVQDYMGKDVIYYEPTDMGQEREIKERMGKRKEQGLE
ncbi:MAG: replication-associated recombination protein A [Candidatus Omnitrophica bacterium]|nr:replication-associated recombination protein A [Candidatus Omnitrophota bacterium]